MTALPHPSSAGLVQSRGWLIFGGILSVLVGLAAIASPAVFSLVIAQLIGAFVLVTGAFAVVLAFTTKHAGHRVLEAVLGVVRIIAGAVLLVCAASSVAVITLIIAVFLLVEGASFLIAAVRMRGQPGVGALALNGVVALLLGVLVYARWPSDSAWVIGTLYGVSSLFWGVSLLSLALRAPRASA